MSDTSSSALSALIERMREDDTWLTRRNVPAEPAAVLVAWTESDDPFAMLLLLAVLHPQHEEPICEALVAAMSFFAPMASLAATMAESRGGMNYNGPDVFRFKYIAQRVHLRLKALGADEVAGLMVRLATAIRSVVPNPYTLPHDASGSG